MTLFKLVYAIGLFFGFVTDLIPIDFNNFASRKHETLNWCEKQAFYAFYILSL